MAQPQQQQQTGGLFGSLGTQPQQQQQQQGGGLFGSSTMQAQQQPSSGLFGASTAQPQQQQTGGLFGQSQNNQQQQTGGLFGKKPTQAASSGLFNQSKPAGGLFGQSTAQPQTSAFGQSALGPGLTMGQSTNNQQSQGQQQVVPGVRIDVSNIRSTTRFNDLQEDLQKQIADIDKAIQGFISQKNELDAFMPAHGDQLSSIPSDVAFVSRKAAGVEAALASDAVAVKQLRELVKVDTDNARLSFKAIDNLKLPTPYHQAGLWSTRGQQATATGGSADVDGEGSSDLVSFFSRTADEMGETMKKFERNLGEIETHLHGVQANVLEQLQRVAATPKDGGQGGSDEKIVELAAVLRDFEESILKVAGVVGGAREGVTQLQLGEFLGNGTNGVH
ncbi:hypothetical protein CONLIGDRAFT_264656 [Coniochaeta ligniaria NRRL 30616]|uniref:Nucleoporin NUP49/NSP49 n=1 Tax=Coniochaeta ligniaria NRRL 30616 TaxID=1408157 RepID=A0A1J7JG09_9PEZI|nr:hypothetical protein CONLIGDRAFT_264656 [Coniochaeta ligniaria NRRL 30616]